MPKKSKISKRKREIFDAAAVLFRYKGYAACSMRDLAEKVGLEVSSLYSHIKSKEEILSTLCFYCAEMYADGMAEILASEDDAISQIDAILDMHIDIAIDHPSSMTVFNDEWKHLPNGDLEKFLELRNKYERDLISIIEKGIANKVVKPFPVNIMTNTVLSSMRWIHYSRHQFTDQERAEVKATIKHIVSRGAGL